MTSLNHMAHLHRVGDDVIEIQHVQDFFFDSKNRLAKINNDFILVKYQVHDYFGNVVLAGRDSETIEVWTINEQFESVVNVSLKDNRIVKRFSSRDQVNEILAWLILQGNKHDYDSN